MKQVRRSERHRLGQAKCNLVFRDFAFRTLTQDFFFTGAELSEDVEVIVGESCKSDGASVLK